MWSSEFLVFFKFCFLKSAPPFPFKLQMELVLVCDGLHNFVRQCRPNEFPPEKGNVDRVESILVNGNSGIFYGEKGDVGILQS